MASVVGKVIDEKLPDDVIVDALRALLSDSDEPFELEEDKVYIPHDAQLEVIAKTYHSYRVDMGMQGFRVLVAVGGLKSLEFGIAWANICFATLYFCDDGVLRTSDFSSKML